MSSGVNKTFLMKVDGKPNDFNYQTIHFTLGRSSLASVETFWIITSPVLNWKCHCSLGHSASWSDTGVRKHSCSPDNIPISQDCQKLGSWWSVSRLIFKTTTFIFKLISGEDLAWMLEKVVMTAGPAGEPSLAFQKSILLLNSLFRNIAKTHWHCSFSPSGGQSEALEVEQGLYLVLSGLGWRRFRERFEWQSNLSLQSCLVHCGPVWDMAGEGLVGVISVISVICVMCNINIAYSIPLNTPLLATHQL